MPLSSVPSVGAAPPFLHFTTSAIVLVLVMEAAKIDCCRNLLRCPPRRLGDHGNILDLVHQLSNAYYSLYYFLVPTEFVLYLLQVPVQLVFPYTLGISHCLRDIPQLKGNIAIFPLVLYSFCRALQKLDKNTAHNDYQRRGEC